MSEIAALAEVSVSTVSRALAGSQLVSQALRNRIAVIAEEHGYVVNQAARNLRLQTTGTIGLVLPMGHETGQQIIDPFLLELIGRLSDEVFKRGYDLLMSRNPSPRPGWLKDMVQSHRFDGMLVLGQSDQHEAINALADSYPPMVVWGQQLNTQAYCTVGVDNIYGGRLATEHLIAQGRKHILFLGPIQAPEIQCRLQGYVEALTEAGTPPKPAQIVGAHFTYGSAFETVRELLAARRKFDAIFAASDVIAMAAMTALAQAGRDIPGDVAVCGFDDVVMASTLTPPLTTIRQDIGLGAQMMVDLLFQRIGGGKTSSAMLPASLIIRASS